METGKLTLWAHSDRLFLPLVVVLVAVLAAIIALFTLVFSTMRVDGESMAPFLHSGDLVLVTRGYGASSAGDIVAFPVMNDAGAVEDTLIKRVVGLPGERVQVVGDTVYVDGVLSDVAPTAYLDPSSGWDIDLTVPAGHVFVLGDNRPIALDSRQLGPVPINSIRGKAVAILTPLGRARKID